MEVTGKVALVAGATSGLGLATAELFATRGAKVALLGRRGDLARKLAGSLNGEAIGVEAEAVAAAIAETVGPNHSRRSSRSSQARNDSAGRRSSPGLRRTSSKTTTSTPRRSASTPATGSRPEAVFRVGFGRR